MELNVNSFEIFNYCLKKRKKYMYFVFWDYVDLKSFYFPRISLIFFELCLVPFVFIYLFFCIISSLQCLLIKEHTNEPT